MSEAREKVSPEDELRAHAYGLLGSLLARVPDQELLERLMSIEVDEDGFDQTMVAAWKTLAMAAGRTTREAVDDEYHALFIGIGRGELVPYGSWYQTGFLMERPLAQLRQDLKSLGFERREGVKEPEDHAGALMETMCMMILDTDIGIHEEKRFFERHLEPWIGRFFEDLQNARSANFYSAVGVLGKQFVDVEKQYLAMLPH
ncbi:MAG TPA: molecular chaperone TorD family protein [Arenicellales bacterium]|nr:molecular chaperone TorD family protein [Arenicellales bacterium]